MATSPRIRNALTLFSAPDCVVCHRVRLVLAAKGVSYELVPVDSAHPPEDLLDLNPYHSVPDPGRSRPGAVRRIGGQRVSRRALSRIRR